MYECPRGKLHDENHSDEGECYFCNTDDWMMDLEKRVAELEANGVIVIETEAPLAVGHGRWPRGLRK